MTYPHVADQLEHVPRMKHVTDLPIVLAQMQFVAIAGHHARRILATMLQHQQTIIDHLSHRLLADYSDYSTHITKPINMIR